MAKPQKTGKKKNISSAKSGVSDSASKINHVSVKYEFYRDGYRAIRTVALMQSIFILLFVIAVMYFLNVYKSERIYFATTNSGKLIPLVALDNPNLTNPALMSWVSQVVTEVLTFGFNDYRQRLNEASRHFTRVGWESFASALERAEFMEKIENKQMIVTSIPAGAPVVVSEGLVNGRYQWEVNIPMNITFQAGNKKEPKRSNLTITIVRVPYLENPNGIGIERWKQM